MFKDLNKSENKPLTPVTKVDQICVSAESRNAMSALYLNEWY